MAEEILEKEENLLKVEEKWFKKHKNDEFHKKKDGEIILELFILLRKCFGPRQNRSFLCVQ